MPNIEIRGYSSGDAEKLKKRIDKVIQQMGLGEEAITSKVSLDAESCDGKRTQVPYLRICSSDVQEIDKIVIALHNSRIYEDVELFILTGFISRQQMRAGELAYRHP